MAGTTASFAHLKQLRLPSLFNRDLINRVHKHWFADLPPESSSPTEQDFEIWFGLNRTQEQKSAFDASLNKEFSEALAALSPTQYPLPAFQSFHEDRSNAGLITMPLRRLDILKTTDFEAKSQAGLGIVLLLDQFSRNIFREKMSQALCYGHYDRLSRALVHLMFGTISARDDGEDLANLHGIGQTGIVGNSIARRYWLYMPLMHSENLNDHVLFQNDIAKMKQDAEQHGEQGVLKLLTQALDYEKQHKVIIEQFGRYPYRNECLGRESTEAEEKYLNEGGERFTS